MKSHTVANKRVRNWCFTLNNYSQDDIEKVKAWESTYVVIGKEKAPSTGTPHLQGYISFPNARTLIGVKKLHAQMHWEEAKGNAQQNFDYCSKDGDFEEIGERPKAPNNKGGTNALGRLKEDIFAGRKVADIIVNEPNMYHQFGRTLNAIEDEVMVLKRRSEMTNGIWVWGPTGVGKSHFAFNFDTPENTYVHAIDSDWWDNYRQQKVVVINEFRGEIKFSRLLELCDKWPTYVRRRGRAPLPFISETIIITSCSPPEEIFKNIEDDDRFDQFYRRFEIKRLDQWDQKAAEDPADGEAKPLVSLTANKAECDKVHTVGRGNTTKVCATSEPDPVEQLLSFLK